jgi:Flp pilus assembly pilin Flp
MASKKTNFTSQNNANPWTRFIKTYIGAEEGQAVLEYGLVVLFVSIALVAAVAVASVSINGLFTPIIAFLTGQS